MHTVAVALIIVYCRRYCVPFYMMKTLHTEGAWEQTFVNFC